jgi:drug/metabolite transporter (DMT)-like permease
MFKLLLILMIALVFESTGVILLKRGISEVGEVRTLTTAEIWRVVKTGSTNGQIWLGMFFEALFFGGLLYLMGHSDISLLWPLTGLSFVFATFAAIWFLHEKVGPYRWAGVLLIMIGAGLISYSEHVKPKPATGAAVPANATPGQASSNTLTEK